MIQLRSRLHKFILCLVLSHGAFSQEMKENNHPRGYFQWPLATKPAIVANFGELRPNHFHMGLDCRTDQKQNIPVLAAADGYIARVKIEPFGFGRCIYVNHPNGLTTLYAHLNDFNPELERYVTGEQYRLKNWKVFLDIPPRLFPVKKGQPIAFSGNTGGSQGPHLHFEIRDTKTDNVLNPLLFGFPIADAVPPVLLRLAVYDRTASTFEQTPKLYSLKKTGGVYETSPGLITTNSGLVSFAISAVDRITGSSNNDGIYKATLYNNEVPVISFRMDDINYDATRYFNAHIDYRLRSGGGPYVQHLSVLPGYANSIYDQSKGNGVIRLERDSTYPISVEVLDTRGNRSLLCFNIRNIRSPAQPEITSYPKDPLDFRPGFLNVFDNGKVCCVLPENSLYDSLHFQYRETPMTDGFSIHQLHNGNIPVHSYFPVMIKATVPDSLTGKLMMERSWNGKTDYELAEPVLVDKGWYRSYFRAFGNFRLLIDTIPPVVVPLGLKDGMNAAKLKRLAFVISDNTENIGLFTATLDGQWLRFTNDKGRVFAYSFDEHCPPGDHELIITVSDQANNTIQKTYRFTR